MTGVDDTARVTDPLHEAAGTGTGTGGGVGMIGAFVGARIGTGVSTGPDPPDAATLAVNPPELTLPSDRNTRKALRSPLPCRCTTTLFAITPE